MQSRCQQAVLLLKVLREDLVQASLLASGSRTLVFTWCSLWVQPSLHFPLFEGHQSCWIKDPLYPVWPQVLISAKALFPNKVTF